MDEQCFSLRITDLRVTAMQIETALGSVFFEVYSVLASHLTLSRAEISVYFENKNKRNSI
jgi:hypothetical protein